MAFIFAFLPLIYVTIATAQKATPSVNWNNVTGTSHKTFPTDVGILGETEYGATPFLAEKDRLNSSKPFGYYGVDLRFEPLNAKEDNATSNDIFHNLGQTSPYFPAHDLFPETHGYENVPKQCKIKQVHILHRHGSRYPASGGGASSVQSLGEKVHNASKAGKLDAKDDLAFLKHWNYSLGSEVLVHQGAQELFDSGVKHYYAYAKLLENLTDHKPVVRTTSQSRMIDSARYWALGFFGWDAPSKINLEVINEIKGQNNTLVPYFDCNNQFFLSNDLNPIWRKKYLKNALSRIQKQVKGVNLTITDIYNMQSMCAYEVVALGYSHFCGLFTKQEWEHFEYDLDLSMQANSGFMNPGSKALGIGYVTELLDRLQHNNFKGPQSEQNRTLDQNPTYFPLDQRLYADFTHDVVIQMVLTALNFTQIADYLPTTKPDPERRYRTSRITPFGARVVFEVLDCEEEGKSDNYLRVKINEALVPLDQDQGCKRRKDSLCKLHDFVKYQKTTAFKAAKYDLFCHGKNGTDFTVTGPVKGGALTHTQVQAGKKNSTSTSRAKSS